MKQTKKDIQSAFLSLARTKPVDKITVKEIVEACGLNRNSFYYHYEDMTGLIESIVEDLLVTCTPEEALKDPQNSLIEAAKAFEENRWICLNIYTSKEREYLKIRLSKTIRHLMGQLLDLPPASNYDISEEDRHLIIDVYEAEVYGLVIKWLDGSLFDLSSSLQRIFDLRDGTLGRMLERADQTGIQTK